MICFKTKTGIASVDENQKLIWGFEKQKVTFGEVLARVNHKERDRFIETVDSKLQCVQTHIISLENGSKIKEWYRKFYHQEDYQIVNEKHLESLEKYLNGFVSGTKPFKAHIIILSEISNALHKDDAVEIRGFGRFSVKNQKPRVGRNPKSGTKINIPAKKALKWKCSKILLKRLNKNFNKEEISVIH